MSSRRATPHPLVMRSTSRWSPVARRTVRAQRSARRRGRWLHKIVPFVLVLVGIGVFAYPVVATQYNNAKQREFAQLYNHDVEQASTDDLAGQLAAAHAYNDSLDGVPILDPWLSEVSRDPNSDAYKAYLGELSLLSAMARVRVPSINVDIPVYHGTSDEVLSKGAGHLYGTALPVGGEGTHAVLTSHTGLPSATLFDHLINVKEGDKIYVDVMGETLAYEVDGTEVVEPNQIDGLRPVAGQDLLTLFTCTPYGVNSHRLMVHAHRIAYDPAVQGAAPDSESPGWVMESWMWWLLGGAGVGLLSLLAIVIGNLRRRRRLQRRRARLAEPSTAGGSS